jgi:hypothetical protein
MVKGVSDEGGSALARKKNVAVVRLRVQHLSDLADIAYEKSKGVRKCQKLFPGLKQAPSLAGTPSPIHITEINLPQQHGIPLVPLPVVLPFASANDDTESSIEFPVTSDVSGSTTKRSLAASSFFSANEPPTCDKTKAILEEGSISERFPTI